MLGKYLSLALIMATSSYKILRLTQVFIFGSRGFSYLPQKDLSIKVISSKVNVPRGTIRGTFGVRLSQEFGRVNRYKKI